MTQSGHFAAVAAFALLVAPAVPAFCQTQGAPAPDPHDRFVLHPPAQVDPGINRPAPVLPPQSTPVIHPKRLRPTGHGSVRVVPK